MICDFQLGNSAVSPEYPRKIIFGEHSYIRPGSSPTIHGMDKEVTPIHERLSLKQIEGMANSYLRGGEMGKSTSAQIDGLKRRQLSWGISADRINEAIHRGIESSPNRNSEKAEELRRRHPR